MTEDGRARILIVEDDIDLQTAYSMILSSQGLSIKTASDGIQGLNALSEFNPKIVLLDYFMPRMDGKGFLENFDVSKYPETIIVVISNIADHDALEEMVRLGASSYVLKADLSPTDLIRLVDDLTS